MYLILMHILLLPLIALPLLASPSPNAEPLRIPLVMRGKQYSRSVDERVDWLKGQAENLRGKYVNYLGERGQELVRRARERREKELLAKRASGEVTIEDIGIDASYAGQVAVGTPASNFLVILDTGSSDLWLAGSSCSSSSCQGITTFDPSKSSTFKSTGQPFDITYGSGRAVGLIATDNVEMGGFTVNDQIFAVVNATTAQLIQSPLSGLMGLAWKSIAATGGTPFWQQLASSGSWSDSEMGFFLERFRGDVEAEDVEANGGEFTMGGLDTTKFTGNVNYVSIAATDEDYWRIPLLSISVQGSSVPGLTNRESAIDTGTTLIGAPQQDVQAIYAQIPNASPMSQSTEFQGYWQYPCNTEVNVTLNFGGIDYTISNADFNLGQFTNDQSMCTGAFFEMDVPSESPISWTVGASFLKNVYSAFRFNPPAVGFATLSQNAQEASNGTSISGSSTTGGGTAGGQGSQPNTGGSGPTPKTGNAGCRAGVGLWGVTGVAAVMATLI